MGMHAVGVKPLIDRLENHRVDQVWYADDSATGGSIEKPKEVVG